VMMALIVFSIYFSSFRAAVTPLLLRRNYFYPRIYSLLLYFPE